MPMVMSRTHRGDIIAARAVWIGVDNKGWVYTVLAIQG
jgi:hypothetical protein